MKKPGLIFKILVLAPVLILAQISDLPGQSQQVFTSNGTFTVPDYVYSITVQCWGAGGGGGSSNTNNGNPRAGGGGGGGGYSMSVIPVIPGTNYNVVVGSGGTGGSGGAGSAGGSSTFNVTNVVANGGSGGSRGGNGNGGAGATAGTGTTTYTGGTGANGANGTGSGGGGGGAGSTGNGGAASGMTGGTGASQNGGNGGAGRNTTGAGNNGNNYGGGGSGGYALANGGDRTGGSGANGYVLISWTGPFYSQGSGDPSVLANWNTNPAGGGTTPSNFTTNNQVFIIQNGHTMTTTGTAWSVSGNNTKVIIRNGGILTESTSAITLSVNTTLQIDDGGTLNHNVNSATIFSGTVSIGTASTVKYGYAGGQSVYSATYGNLTFAGSGAKNIPAGVTVNATLSLEGTATTTNNTPLYGASATLQYKGSSSQTTGIELPATFSPTGGIVINNSSGVSLSASLTLNSTLTLTAGAFGVGANTLTLNGPAISGATPNLSTTASSNLIFGGTSTGVFIPSSVTSLRNLTINNSNGVTVNSNITLASAGVLTITSGILNAGTYIISVTNSAAAAIVVTTGSFVNVTTGSFQRTIASGLSGSGNNYLFPIGESNVYKALNLIDVNTGATGPILRASVSATGALTGDNTTIGPVDPRYWSLINTNSGNLTSAKVELYETGLDATKTIGMSPAAAGTYVSVGGSLNSSSMTSSTIAAFNSYFCIGSIWINTFYSYRTGQWNDFTTWTTDPSGTLQIGNAVPGNNARVFILADRSVTLPADITATGLEIKIESGGILDQTGYRFTNPLAKLYGQGTLRLASINFPSAAINTFILSGGGTAEYYNSSDFTIPSSPATYNNLTINCSSRIATQLNNLTLYGHLYVKSGTFRINDNTSTAKLNLTINGNVTVDNGASFTVGNGVTNSAIGSAGSGGSPPFLNYYLNFHSVIINGNLTNNGTVKFTNLAYPLFTSFPPTSAGATSGAASVYFQGAADNTVTCNGITDFYNLIVNKGTDQTYKLTINSSAYTNFRLFGANSLAAEAVTANPTLKKALWVYSGTLVLKGSLIIPSLSEGTAANADYYIPSNGALSIDGTDVVILSTSDDYREVNTAYGTSAPDNVTIGVTQGGFSALDVFGKLEINNGFISTRESGGIITSSTASGQIIINGGTVDAKQLLGSTGSASYTQTGGLLILRGRFRRVPSSYATVANITDVSITTLGTARVNNGINTAYGTFNLENSTNIYTNSGGTIRIYDVTLNTGGKAFDVKSSSSNINVNGGTLEIIPVTGTALADAASYLINSTAPVYDLTIDRISSASVAGLSAALTIQNDFNLNSGVLTANNLNLTIGGDFTVANGTTYTPGNNTTILNGSGKQTITINLGSALSLNALTLNKSAGDTILLAGSQNTVNVNGNFNLTAGTLNDGGKTINLSGGTVNNSGRHCGSGVIVLNGAAAQAIDGNGIFQNITLNNTSGTAVALAANMTINGTLTFSNDALFNIGTYNLQLNSQANIVNYGANRYICTAGNAGDGGLTRVFSSTTALAFPVGAPTITPSRAVKYTLATIGFSSPPTTYGSVTVIPVGYENANTTTKGQSLTYYWRVKSSGFSGIQTNSVVHTFVYGQTDVVGAETNYVPSLYDAAVHLWYYGTTASINTTTNTISDWTTPTNSTNFLDADYTAGLQSGFGTPKIYYSRRSGLWSTLSTWSLTSHTVDNAPTVAPGANDIVLIGGQDSVYLATNNTTANTGVQNCATLQIESGSALDIGYNPACNFALVLSSSAGNGNFRLTTNYNSPSTFAFPTGDFSDFNVNRGTTELYTTNPTAGTEYYMPTGISSYGNLILSPLGGSNLMFPNNSVTIYGNLITRGQNADSWFVPSWGTTYPGGVATIAKTITVMGNMDIQGGALIWYQNSNIAQNFVVYGNVRVGTLSSLFVYSGATNQSMAIGGNLINNANGGYNGVTTISKADFTNIPLTYFGSSSSVISSTIGTPSTTFGSVTVNKGTSQATTLTCNIAGTLTTPADNWLTLQNGTFIYNRTGNFTISQGTDFTIPITCGLTLNTPSNVYIANSGSNNLSLFLNGRMTILGTGSNVYIGPPGNTSNNADIEYSGSGASALEIQGGNLFVNGQIRRPLVTTNGILSYTQSGGNVYIFGNNPLAANLTKAKLEVLNNGSSFSMSGGTLTIVRGGGTTFGDLYLRPSASSVSGGTIIFSQVPASGPVIDAIQSYSLDANISLNNLTVIGKTATAAQNATLSLMVSPLALNGSLTISNVNSIFVSNNLNVSLKGDLNNSGNYTYGTNVTTFNGGTQQITGSAISSFYDLEVLSLSSLTVNNSFSVNRNLSIRNGNLVLGPNRVTLLGNLVNNSSYTDNNGSGGITLAGAVQQQVSGTGLFGLLALNNSEGARLYSDINLQNNLVLTTGIFDINIYQLTLNQNSQVTGAPFSRTKMIKADGVMSCLGVKKSLNSGPQTFTFPVGVPGKYTPVVVIITASSTAGYIRVNPVNSTQPSITDPLSALKYYWQIENSGLSGMDATVTLQYSQDDVFGNEADYVAGRLEFPANIWHEALPGPATDNVDETNNLISFVFSSATNLNGDYTAGNSAAIPGEVPSYQTNSDGLWSNAAIWTPLGTSPPCPAGGPSGAVVIINHVVSVNTNRIYVFSTTINNRLRILSPTYGHNLGYIYGNGVLYLEGGNLHGGNYSAFTDCSGNGTLEYGGTGTYSIIGTLLNSLPNISFTGSGTRVLPNKDLTICKRLIIDGPTLDNSVNNRKLTILGTMERYNTGVFTSGTGASPASTVSFAGTSVQTLGGATGNFTGTSKFNNFEINNPAGLIIYNGGSIEVNNQLLLTNGIITTGSTSTFTLLNTSSSAVTPSGGSSSSFISGPLTKYIINGDNFEYPLGKGTIKGHSFIVTSTAGTTLPITAEFFTPNTTATSVASPLKVTNTAEYWSIQSTIATTVKVSVTWDPQSDLTPLMATHGLSDMRVAQYVAGFWTQINSVTTGDENNGTVETKNSVAVSPVAVNFTSACISGTLARAAFSVTGYICGITGIPVSFTSFDPINLNYTLGYSVNGSPQTPVTVSVLPYTLPTLSEGVYKLTSFTYNNGAGTGVVDAQTVTVYALPTTSAAGSDQSLCGLSTTTLQGNNPSPNSGLWTIVSGTGGSFVSSAQFNTVFNGILGNTYTLRWTISNGPCTSSDDVVISFPVVASTPGDFTSAPNPACQGTAGNTYTVPFVAGVVYAWSFTGTGHTIHGTGNSVTIDFSSSATGGTLSVTATNSCGTSSPRSVDISIPTAAFTYTGSPYCQNAPNPLPGFGTGGVAGTFSSTAGLVFVSASTGQIDLAASAPGTYTVTNTAVTAGCGTLVSTSPVIISGLAWTGTISSDWNVPGNWSCGFVPYPTTHVTIPDVAQKPVLSAGNTGSVNNLTIDPGSSLTVNGNTLKIAGTITNNGTFSASAGTIEMNGSAAQAIGNNVFSGNTVKDLLINNAAGVILLGPMNITGSVAVLTGNLNSAGFLTLVSSASQTAYVDGSGSGNITGSVTMQRYLPSGFGYKYLSSPFQNALVSELGNEIDLSASFPLIYGYDESRTSSGWIDYVTPASLLNPISGYAVNFGSSASSVTVDISGTVNNGAMSATLYNHNNSYTKGFNLVGNPYPSPIDWNAPSGWTKNNIDNAIYYFKAGSTDEWAGTYSTYINGVSSDPGVATNIIPSMQGFFIHVSDGSYPVTGTLGLTNSVRVTDLTHPLIKSGEIPSKPLIRLKVSFAEDTASSDPVVLYFDEKAGNEFDGNIDAIKLFNTDYNIPNLYTLGNSGKKLAIDALPVLSDSLYKVPLGLTLYKDGYLIFRIVEINDGLQMNKVYLTDLNSGTEQDLLNGKEYKVFLNEGEYNNRFWLNLLPSATAVPEVIAENDVFNAYSSHGIIRTYVNTDKTGKGTISVTNLTGQTLVIKKVLEPGYFEFNPGIKDGIYFVTFRSGTFMKTKKVLIHN